MNIKKICVCGAGTMGRGIALTSAQAGFCVILYDLNREILSKAKQYMENNLEKLVVKGKINASEKKEIVSRVVFTDDENNCIADLIIEAIVEKLAVKTNLFNQLAAINSSNVIFASNTSSLPITEIAGSIPYPENFIGMHFFNPATIMKLVEIVKTSYTSADVLHSIKELTKKLGKTPVVCNDSPGFIVNRVARPFYIESLRIAEENPESFLQTDTILESTGFKMGPFKLMDLIGNDVNYAVSCSVYEQLNKPDRLKPSIIQEEKVKQGKLGKKTGEGYYSYQ